MTYIGNALCWVARLYGIWLGFRFLRRAVELGPSPDLFEPWLFWLNLTLGIAFPVAIWWLGSNIRVFFDILSTRPTWEFPRSGWRLAALVFSTTILVACILALILVEPPSVPAPLGQ